MAVAPLLRISSYKLLIGEQAEIDRLWRACCDLGFFYLDLRGGRNSTTQDLASPEKEELASNVWREQADVKEAVTGTNNKIDHSPLEDEVEVNGDQLIQDANRLFEVGESIFQLPVLEKVEYGFKDQGSYFGYKDLRAGVIDAEGTKD